ncbi:PP2C family protein-serine/threonine phosphatase [Limnovirga soli]|uniref:Serine/threonine-protein phosphatase n=1 Tax=Limnovirga soli TaxID=2656915 RepID=A0A8J8JVS0_9BACT|nr:protein phosphatase 2C domain-containing protein [Limnovirga soli]NNV56944.1 serine/threonine-protein phosphatase [Limnovirga soli]
MQISFKTISSTGKREQNEDAFLTIEEAGIFIVCDGVGGSNKGEIASNKTCDSIKNYFKDFDSETISISEIKKSIIQSEDFLTEYVNENPESEGMATTLSFLKLSEQKSIIAHIGDSRVYHIREGKILFQTQDHSLVNELVASGFIKPEEAKSHPKKNVITKAIQGNGENAEPDFYETKDLQVNDYFLLCTDGILESIDNAFIEANFISTQNLTDLANTVFEQCDAKSNDNFTAVFIKLIEIKPENLKSKSWFSFLNIFS